MHAPLARGGAPLVDVPWTEGQQRRASADEMGIAVYVAWTCGVRAEVRSPRPCSVRDTSHPPQRMAAPNR